MNDKMDTGAARPVQPAALIDALQDLRIGPRGEDFYDQYCALAQALCGADCALVVGLSGDKAIELGGSGTSAERELLLSAATPERWAALQEKGFSHDSLRKADGLGLVLLLVRLLDEQATVLLLALPERQRAHIKEALIRAMLLRDLRPGAVAPGSENALMAQSQATNAGLLHALALATEVMQAPRFGAASLALVNGVIRLCGLRQAVLCWRMGGGTEVVAISHLERFEKTSRLVQSMQAAANEVLAVDRVLSVNTLLDATAPDLNPPAHWALLESLDGVQAMDGLPIRDSSGQTQAVLLCASDGAGLKPEMLNNLLLMLELVLPQLAESRQQNMGIFQRARSWALEHLSVLFGPGRPWLKFWTVVLAVVFLVLAFGRMPYRVEASAQFTTDSVRALTAHNDGRLQEVVVDIGDRVTLGQVMSRMDTTDLRQQELEVRSELQRFQAEEDKARAAGALADLEVARFRRAQSQARLQRVLNLMTQADTLAPFDGVVVEGERRNLLGASVRRGDPLFRVAQVQGLYLVLQLPERDIRDVSLDSVGELVLLSQPGRVIPFKVNNLVPMAQVKGDEGNHFLLKAEINEPVQDWWRPGMVGLAKIDVGPRNIAWILFHRLVDTLRLWFWF